MPENKVKLENGKTYVLWSVVDENGDIMEQYFEATNLKKGSKKECGELIDRLKKSREKADITNKDGRIGKKPAKLDDYEGPSSVTPQTGKPPLKRPRKALFQVQFDPAKTLQDFKDLSTSSSEELAGDVDEHLEEDLDESIVLARWKQNVASKTKSNGFSRQHRNVLDLKPKKVTKQSKENEKKWERFRSKSSLKKAREETADSQSCDISRHLAFSMMRVVRHGCNGSTGPVEFSINVSHRSTLGALRQQLSQMTGIQPANQLLVIKGKELVIEEDQKISEVWSPEDLSCDI